MPGMIRVQLDNKLTVEATTEQWIIAFLQAFQGPALEQIVKNVEMIKQQTASGLVIPNSNFKPVIDGLKKP